MKKKIFIRNGNEIVDCEIYIDDLEMENLSMLLDDTSSVGSKRLIMFAQRLLTEEDVFTLSRAVRAIGSFHPTNLSEKTIKNLILDSIVLGDYSLKSIFLSEEEMDNVVFLRQFRSFLREKIKQKEDVVQYSESYQKAVQETLTDIELLNQEMFEGLVSQADIEFSDEEKEQYKIRMMESLPYTKK